MVNLKASFPTAKWTTVLQIWGSRKVTSLVEGGGGARYSKLENRRNPELGKVPWNLDTHEDRCHCASYYIACKSNIFLGVISHRWLYIKVEQYKYLSTSDKPDLDFHILPNSLYIIIKLGAVYRQKHHLHFYFFLSQIIGGQNIAWTYLEEKLKIQLIYWLILFLVFQQYFSYIMATSFSGGGSRSTRRNHRPWASNW
jgi:hypothetical protein